jgi:hypothetical protein
MNRSAADLSAMNNSKELVKRAIEFKNPERVPYNFDSNWTPVIAEKYGDDFEWVFSRVDPDFKPRIDNAVFCPPPRILVFSIQKA